MIYYFGKIILHGFADSRVGDGAMLDQLSVLIAVVGYAVQISGIFIEPVKTQFKAHVLQYQQAGGHADRESGDIDERKGFILHQVAPGSFKIVLKHDPLSLGLNMAHVWLRQKMGQWVCQMRNPLHVNELNRKTDLKVSGNEQQLYEYEFENLKIC